jgi:NAD(P)-dependent dehydrogenase (short-subunit alcohol dehydrogenase family)
LGADGYRVVVNFRQDHSAAEAVVTEIMAAGGSAIAVQADVGLAPDRQRLVEQTREWGGPLAVLVNNAGITSPGRLDLLEASEENWDQVMATNLKGPFFLSQLAAREMIGTTKAESAADAAGQRGAIINISSVSAYAVSTNRADYCIAKTGLQMTTWLFATRLAEEGIHVYEISPGIVESDMTAPVRDKYDTLIAEGLTPIRRWGTPADVARAVSALAGGAFPYCTGQRVHIDGGFHIRRL